MKVICISGKARHGKDTLAGVLKKHLELTPMELKWINYGENL